MAFKEFNEREDDQLPRHVALHFTFADNSPRTIYHITGSVHNWRFERRENYDPVSSNKDIRTYTVGELSRPTNDEEINARLADVAVDNADREVTCQTWIGDALKHLGKSGLLSEKAVEEGLDGMVNLVVEWEADDDVERSDSVVKKD
ncbi:hypothetical protein M409DRAFT_15647 [Zasmidium cellare ATCC 36951]|uniref:Uncharacterized protein n=1 Tax=Zasmidium cellare ATCC 36951 TaxID=1080233 RepID=A0A6A6D575_ZASCE|nr:uncharacterized protein M409DRAFT_15647 [Zasmidium cellare ATCC 36951]KAF2173362.1 hypothetical protein M409DRAFT_15647 [Zasmidium cellare ATCC 36951]